MAATMRKKMTASAWATPSWPIFLYIVLTMLSAAIWVCLAGAPLVRARFWSYILKVLARVRNRQMVIEGMIIGSVTLRSVCHLPAPSICEASMSSGGTFCRPAM